MADDPRVEAARHAMYVAITGGNDPMTHMGLTGLAIAALAATDRVALANAPEDEERRQKIIAIARDDHCKDGVIEIDDDAVVSEGDDNGAYVQAWVWVSFADTELDKDKPDAAV